MRANRSPIASSRLKAILNTINKFFKPQETQGAHQRQAIDRTGRIKYNQEGLKDDPGTRIEEPARMPVPEWAFLPEENPNPVLRIDRTGVLLYANPASQALMELWGCQVGQPAPDSIRVVALEAMSTGQRRVVELPYSEWVLAFTVVPIPAQGYINLYGSDITERVRDAQRMAYLVNLLENIHDAVIATDSEFRITAWNKGAEELYGWRASEVMGRNVDEVIPTTNTSERQANRSQLRQTGQFTGVMVHYNRNGQPVYVEARSLALVDEAGRITGYASANRDITHRKKFEQEREELIAHNRRQKELLERIFNSSPTGMALIGGKQSRYLMVNPAYRSFTRNADLDPTGRTVREIWPGDLGQLAHDVVQQVIETGEPYQINRATLQTSEEASQVIAGMIQRIEYENEPAVLTVLWKVTELEEARAQAETALQEVEKARREATRAAILAEQAAAEAQEREMVLQTVFNAMTEAVTIFDIEGNYIRTNPAAVAYYGSDMIGKTRFEAAKAMRVANPDGSQIPVEDLPVTHASRGETVRDRQLRFTNYHGQTYDVVCSAAPLYVNDVLVGSVMVLRDVTERELLVRQLREISERFYVALKNAPVSVYTLDRDLRFTWVYKPPFDFGEEQMLGRRDDELLPPEQVGELVAVKRQVLKSGEGARKEFRLRMGNQERIYDITMEPMRSANGEVSGLTVAWIDITGQRQMEAEARERAAQIEIQRQILRHRELERMEIARDLHDGPLQEMIGLSFSINEMISTDNKEERMERLRRIQETLQDQIHDVRAFCSELRPPALAPFGLEKAIRSHVEGLKEKHPRLKINLDLMRDGKTLPEELRMTLFRVYQEAINNITKHAGASEVWVQFRFDDEQVELEVRDNGRGFRLPGQWVSLARQGHLGLVGMHERVAAIGGQLKIESEQGKGATIRLKAQRV